MVGVEHLVCMSYVADRCVVLAPWQVGEVRDMTAARSSRDSVARSAKVSTARVRKSSLQARACQVRPLFAEIGGVGVRSASSPYSSSRIDSSCCCRNTLRCCSEIFCRVRSWMLCAMSSICSLRAILVKQTIGALLDARSGQYFGLGADRERHMCGNEIDQQGSDRICRQCSESSPAELQWSS